MGLSSRRPVAWQPPHCARAMTAPRAADAAPAFGGGRSGSGAQAATQAATSRTGAGFLIWRSHLRFPLWAAPPTDALIPVKAPRGSAAA